MVKLKAFVCLFLARQPKLGQGLLIYEVSRSHTTTHHSRQGSSEKMISSFEETSTWQHTTLTTDNTSTPPVGLGRRPQTYALDRAATGTGLI